MSDKILRLAVLFLIPIVSYSQRGKVLSVGDNMPLLKFTHIYNSSVKSISLSDYKGKLVIIDFWNRWCGTCIEAFPKMEALQNEFGDKIKILLVTDDKDDLLLKLFKKVKQPSLPIISEDSVLNRMFPHTTVPHHVWVNPDGRVQFITDAYNATSKNISKVLNKIDFKLRLKREAIDADEHADLLKEGNGRMQKFITSYSVAMTKLTDIIDATYYGYIKDTINHACSFKFVNLPLLDLYKIAYSGSVGLNKEKEFERNNRVQFRIPGGDLWFTYPNDTDSIPSWEDRNIVSYEAKWKTSNDSLAFEYLQKDANRFFPFTIGVENTEVDCYILKTINNLSETKSVSKEKSLKYTDTSYSIKNMQSSVLVSTLNGVDLFKKLPVIDETNSQSKIDVYLSYPFKDIGVLKNELLKNGLLLEEGRRKMRMLVIAPKQ